jgi:hypothetical protein
MGIKKEVMELDEASFLGGPREDNPAELLWEAAVVERTDGMVVGRGG